MNQRFTVLKIGGKSVELFESHIHALEVQAKQDTVTIQEMGNRFEDVMRVLRLNSCSPPVLFYCEFIDAWSMGDIFDLVIGQKCVNAMLRINAANSQIFLYRLPDNGILLQSLVTWIDQNGGHDHASEQELFAHVLYAAVNSWAELHSDAVLMIVRTVVGPSVLDDEVLRSLQGSPDWMAEFNLRSEAKE